jgi:hypothetical protein
MWAQKKKEEEKKKKEEIEKIEKIEEIEEIEKIEEIQDESIEENSGESNAEIIAESLTENGEEIDAGETLTDGRVEVKWYFYFAQLNTNWFFRKFSKMSPAQSVAPQC